MTRAVEKEPAGDVLIRALGVQDAVVGDPGRFAGDAADVVAEARRTGHVEALVVGLRAVAWVERSHLDNRRAARLLDEAARLADRAGLPGRLGEVLTMRAAVNLELGRTGAATRDLDRATGLVDGAAAADLELKRAALLQNTGRPREAADRYRRILALDGVGADVRTRAANNLALAEALRGRSGDALAHIDLATALAPEVGPAFVAIVAQNRGLVLTQAGRLAEGLAQFDRAVGLLTAAGLPLGESLMELADTLTALRALPEAAELADRAVRELEAHDVALMAAEARVKAAEIALLRGDTAAAAEAAAAAAVRFRAQRRRSWVALAVVVEVQARSAQRPPTARELARVQRAADLLHEVGQVSAAVRAGLVAGRAAAALGRPARAARLLREAHRRSGRGPLLVRVEGRLAAALAARLDDDDRGMMRHCRRGLVELAVHRASLASTELRALAAGHGVELGLLGLGCLLRAGSPSRVLDWAERTRSAALLTVEPPAPDTVRDERDALARVHADLVAARRDDVADPAPLIARQTALEHRIRRAVWQRAGGGAPAVAIRTGPLATLLDGRTLVSYGRYDGELYAVVLAGPRRRLVRLGPWEPVRFEADALGFALRRLTRPGPAASLAGARASAVHAIDRLSAALVRPLRIPPDAPLVVVPARDTHQLPWPALHAGPVSVNPSATLWAATAARPRTTGDRVVAVAGPGLPGAEDEVDVVGRRYPGAVVLAPPRSTAAAVLDAVADADLVHFACHGHLRADNPVFSALEVSDGLLTVHELDLRGIAPRRVVLASCDSAADVSYDGDELVGFVGALLARGTAGLVASVVAVGDVESVALMGALHDGLAAGRTTVDALHAARAEIDTDDPRQFVNWCAFTAYGAG